MIRDRPPTEHRVLTDLPPFTIIAGEILALSVPPP